MQKPFGSTLQVIGQWVLPGAYLRHPRIGRLGVVDVRRGWLINRVGQRV